MSERRGLSKYYFDQSTTTWGARVRFINRFVPAVFVVVLILQLYSYLPLLYVKTPSGSVTQVDYELEPRISESMITTWLRDTTLDCFHFSSRNFSESMNSCATNYFAGSAGLQFLALIEEQGWGEILQDAATKNNATIFANPISLDGAVYAYTPAPEGIVYSAQYKVLISFVSPAGQTSFRYLVQAKIRKKDFVTAREASDSFNAFEFVAWQARRLG